MSSNNGKERQYFNTCINKITLERLRIMAVKSHRTVGKMLDYIIEKIWDKYEHRIVEDFDKIIGD